MQQGPLASEREPFRSVPRPLGVRRRFQAGGRRTKLGVHLCGQRYFNAIFGRGAASAARVQGRDVQYCRVSGARALVPQLVEGTLVNTAPGRAIAMAALLHAMLSLSLVRGAPHALCRRHALAAAAAAATQPPPCHAGAQEPSSMRVSWGPFKGLSTEDISRLDAASRQPDAGFVLSPLGVRVIDLVTGDGPVPTTGNRVYAHYKIWADGFRSGPVADYSFQDNRPYGWDLGQPTERIPAGVDAGVAGMREGGWRRLVVPASAAFGDAGLRRVSYGPTGRFIGAKAPYVLRPGATAYVDLVLVDGGSGRCDRLLRPSGVEYKTDLELKIFHNP